MAWATVLTDVTFFFFFNAYIGGGGRWWWRWGAARVRWEEMARHRRSDRRGQHSKRHCCGAGRRSLGERRGQRGNIQIYTVLQILCVGSKWLWLIMKWFTTESPVIRSIFDGRIWLNILMPSLCELWVKWQSALCVTVLNVYFFPSIHKEYRIGQSVTICLSSEWESGKSESTGETPFFLIGCLCDREAVTQTSCPPLKGLLVCHSAAWEPHKCWRIVFYNMFCVEHKFFFCYPKTQCSVWGFLIVLGESRLSSLEERGTERGLMTWEPQEPLNHEVGERADREYWRRARFFPSLGCDGSFFAIVTARASGFSTSTYLADCGPGPGLVCILVSHTLPDLTAAAVAAKPTPGTWWGCG